MGIDLLCHWNGDGDFAHAWLDYYVRMGVSDFHLILHGAYEENDLALRVFQNYPVKIHEMYEGPFTEEEKIRRLTALARKFHGKWILLVDSDELVELPYKRLQTNIDHMVERGSSTLHAPLLQRIMKGGSLDSSVEIMEPFVEFRICSERLYHILGSDKWSPCLDKYPLIHCCSETEIERGNHLPANGWQSVEPYLRGVSHHFKWRRGVIVRLKKAIADELDTAATEAEPYLRYLGAHENKLPLVASFDYSRPELFRRGLLRRPLSRMYKS